MRLSVVGLGKLGSPLAAVLASKGHDVVGVDINPLFVDKINRKIAPVEETGLQELLESSCKTLRATSSYEEAILDSDVTFVIVPTPSQSDGLFSNTYLLLALKEIGLALAKKGSYHLVVITSTVIPGATQGVLKEALEEASGLCLNEHFGLCYNPEFIALGSVIKNMLYPDMLLIGESDSKAGDLLEEIYRSVCQSSPSIRRMNLINAELAKIAVNTFVTTKISYANMLSDICDKLVGADVDVVTEAVGMDSRIGPKYLKGSVPFGGPCFPRDNLALIALARNISARADIAEATQATNFYQFDRLHALIAKKAKTHRIAILGLSYKSDTNVIEESQGIRVSNRLIEAGYEVMVYDPKALKDAQKHLDTQIFLASSVSECIEFADTLVIMTAWPEFADAVTEGLSHFPLFSKTVIDCWRLLDKNVCAQMCELVYLGHGVAVDKDMPVGMGHSCCTG